MASGFVYNNINEFIKDEFTSFELKFSVDHRWTPSFLKAFFKSFYCKLLLTRCGGKRLPTFVEVNACRPFRHRKSANRGKEIKISTRSKTLLANFSDSSEIPSHDFWNSSLYDFYASAFWNQMSEIKWKKNSSFSRPSIFVTASWALQKWWKEVMAGLNALPPKLLLYAILVSTLEISAILFWALLFLIKVLMTAH